EMQHVLPVFAVSLARPHDACPSPITAFVPPRDIELRLSLTLAAQPARIQRLTFLISQGPNLAHWSTASCLPVWCRSVTETESGAKRLTAWRLRDASLDARQPWLGHGNQVDAHATRCGVARRGCFVSRGESCGRRRA